MSPDGDDSLKWRDVALFTGEMFGFTGLTLFQNF